MMAKLAASEPAVDDEVIIMHSSPPCVDRPNSCYLRLTGATSPVTMAAHGRGLAGSSELVAARP
jgi:hypothetical protein